MIIGIDLGISNIKIAGIISGDLTSNNINLQNTGDTQVLADILNEFLCLNNVSLKQVEQIMITGVSAGSFSAVNGLCGRPVSIVDEFAAIGLGGAYLSSVTNAIVVSMGTGTAMVRVAGGKAEHIGGSGIGGGTIVGLSSRIANSVNIFEIMRLAEKGKLNVVDLLIADVVPNALPSLPLHATACSLGKMTATSTDADVLVGIFKMVLQNIGVLAVFAAKHYAVPDVLLTGGLTKLPICKQVFTEVGEMFGVNFILPAMAEYATAVGAILLAKDGGN